MEQKNVAGEQSSIGVAAQNKRPYEAPRIISDEPLEVAAASCSPPTGGFGKSPGFPSFCTSHGS